MLQVNNIKQSQYDSSSGEHEWLAKDNLKHWRCRGHMNHLRAYVLYILIEKVSWPIGNVFKPGVSFLHHLTQEVNCGRRIKLMPKHVKWTATVSDIAMVSMQLYSRTRCTTFKNAHLLDITCIAPVIVLLFIYIRPKRETTWSYLKKTRKREKEDNDWYNHHHQVVSGLGWWYGIHSWTTV